MAYTPNPFLFTEAAGSGLKLGAGLAGLFQERRNRSKLQEIADQVRAGAFEDAGAGLVSMGEIGPGINVGNIPYNRQQAEAEQAFSQNKFLADQAFRERDFSADEAYRRATLDMQRQKLAQDIAQGGNETLGLNPIFATDANGKPVMYQPGNKGSLRQMQFPEGVTPYDPYSKAFETARGREVGEATGTAQADLGRIADNAMQMKSVIDQTLEHPSLSSGTGIIQGNLPAVTQGIQDFRVLVDQIKGKTFLEAFNSLRGGGQITEAEGRKATEALARLNTAQSEAAFRSALMELKGIVDAGVARTAAKSQARVEGQAPARAGAGLTRETAIPIGSEAEADTLPPGTWVILNGKIGKVE